MIRRGVVQQDIADRLGITQTQVSARLRPGDKTEWRFAELAEVADLFDMPLADLVAAAAAAEQRPAAASQ